jgi:hypothetical protein
MRRRADLAMPVVDLLRAGTDGTATLTADCEW